jgi:hypothetical protein
MKILSQCAAIFALIFAVTPTIASEIDECEIWKAKADHYMNLRQQSMPITSAVKEVSGNKSRGLLLQAYAEPVAEEAEMKAEAVLAFSKEVYHECNTSDN